MARDFSQENVTRAKYGHAVANYTTGNVWEVELIDSFSTIEE